LCTCAATSTEGTGEHSWERTEPWREEVKGIRTGRVIVLVRIGYTAAQGLSSVEVSKD